MLRITGILAIWFLLLGLVWAQQQETVDNAIWKLAAKLRRSNVKMVVYELQAPPHLARLANKLGSKLREALVRQDNTVITDDLAAVISEQKIQRSALFDNKTVAEIGQLVGATAIVRGQLLSNANVVDLHLQLVEVKTGKLLHATSGPIPTPEMQKLPEESPAYLNGHTFREKREWDRASACYTQAIAESGDFASYYLYRGICYFRQKQLAKALADYDQAIALDPQFASAYNWRGQLFAARRDYPRAQSDYDQAIRLDPGNGYAYSNLGNLLSRQKQYAAAIRHHQRAVENLPGHGTALFNLACAYAKSGQENQALETLELAVSCGYPVDKIRQDEDLAGLRDLPRFRELVEE